MARATLTAQPTPGKFPGTVAVNAADVTFAVSDAVNGNDVAMSGEDMLIVARNDNAGAQTITITSAAMPDTNRPGDITAYSIGIGEYAVFGPFNKPGWQQSDGKLRIDTSHADIKLAVLRLTR